MISKKEKLSNLNEKINLMKNGDFAVFIIHESLFEDYKKEILGSLIKKLKKGVFVSFGGNLDEMRIFAEKNGFLKNLHLIGPYGLRKSAKNETVIKKDISFEELSEIFFNLEKDNKYKFIFIDSISSIFVRYDIEKTEKFLNYLIEHNRLTGLMSTAISEDSQLMEDTIPNMTKSCRIVLKIDENEKIHIISEHKPVLTNLKEKMFSLIRKK